jgi:hypothetical protein
MKRTAGLMVLLAGLAGCVNDNPGPYMGNYWASQQNPGGGIGCTARAPTSVPGVQGPWGQPVAMAAPYNAAPPPGEAAAKAMLGLNLPLGEVQQAGLKMPAGSPSGVVQAGGPMMLSPPGLPPVPATPGMAPPQGMPPQGMPPQGMPPQGMPPQGMPPQGLPMQGMPLQMGGPRVPGVVAAVGALTGPAGAPFPAQRTQVFFCGPPGMKISWYAPCATGGAAFTSDSIETPGRYNFLQAAIYRLKLTDIPNRANLDLYPTLEVVPANHKTAAFLAHSSVPVSFTDEDLEQVASGNFVIKVIYLPDPQFQDLAMTGPCEVVSSRLEPGVDPIAEACRRGSILLVVRMGAIDLGLTHSPAMDAPSPFAPHPAPPPGQGMGPGPGGLPSSPMVAPAPGTTQMFPAPPPIMHTPLPSGPPGPVSQLPDAGTLPTDYKSPTGGTPTPAELAGQSPTPTDLAPKPDAGPRSQPGPASMPGQP